MNHRMIAYILGCIMKVEAVLMVPSLLVAALHRERSSLSFVITIALLLLLGTAASFKKPKNKVIYAKEGFVIVALSWILLSVFGAIPFVISGAIPNFIDACFETVSGFTTTGSTILTDIEVLPRGILFWRSFTHWIGGMGVLVFVLAIIPLAEGRSMHLMRAEVPGPTVGKLVPKMKSTAMILYGIYIAMTGIEVVFLLFGGMPLYDSLIHAFGTAGTGGFSIMNSSIAHYNSAYIDGVITVFMILFGVNFNLYYYIIIGKIGLAVKNEELRWYFGIIAISILLITLNIYPIYQGVGSSFRYASFQVASIITTTGYATADFNLWPQFSKSILFILTFLGACAGSTGGGIKTSRLILILKSISKEIRHMLHPRSVSSVRLNGKPVDGQVIHGVASFFMVYMVILFASFLLISIDEFDLETTFTATVTCINNVGPGFGLVGPVNNFSIFSPFSKIVLSLDMLIGRLEIFPVIMLFMPGLWKRNTR